MSRETATKEKDLLTVPKEETTSVTVGDGTAQPPALYRVFDTSLEQVKHTMQENLTGVALNQFNLKRYRTPTGGQTAWTIEGARGKQSVEKVRGIMIYHRAHRGYYEKSFEETGGGAPPDCYSWDNSGKGTGTPGIKCVDCQFNEFGSAPKGDGKACKERKALFILRSGDLIPCVIGVGPGSLTAMQSFFIDISNENKPYCWYELEFSLKEERNKKGLAYSQLQIRIVDDLSPEQIERVTAYQQMMMPQLRAVQFDRGDLEDDIEAVQ